METSKRLEIIFHNGRPDGIRSMRRYLSTMTTYVVPRSLLSEAKKVTGIDRPGIYYLISETEDSRIARIYVGQTRNGVSRLEDHNQSKEFWDKAIMFLSDSRTFSLDIISGLEKHAIVEAINANRYTIENSVTPRYEINEYDMPLIEEIYDEIKFIMATQGYSMDDARTKSKCSLSVDEGSPSFVGENDSSRVWHTTRNGMVAYGTWDGEKFDLLVGSQIDMSRKSTVERVERQRGLALENGNIICDDGFYKTTVSFSFGSPSGAAMFVFGTTANGWTEWKNSEGKTINEVLRKR